MERRQLGKSDPLVVEIGLGCMGMSGVYGAPDEAEVEATIRRAVPTKGKQNNKLAKSPRVN